MSKKSRKNGDENHYNNRRNFMLYGASVYFNELRSEATIHLWNFWYFSASPRRGRYSNFYVLGEKGKISLFHMKMTQIWSIIWLHSMLEVCLLCFEVCLVQLTVYGTNIGPQTNFCHNGSSYWILILQISLKWNAIWTKNEWIM